MSETIDDSGNQPGEEEAKLEECFKCQVWCECDGSGVVIYYNSSFWDYCDCAHYSHTCGKED